MYTNNTGKLNSRYTTNKHYREYSNSKLIQFKINNEQYKRLQERADEQHLSVNLYCKQLVQSGINGNIGLTPELLVTLTGMYNMLQVPQDKWNSEMHKNFREGMDSLYGKLFCGQ